MIQCVCIFHNINLNQNKMIIEDFEVYLKRIKDGDKPICDELADQLNQHIYNGNQPWCIIGDVEHSNAFSNEVNIISSPAGIMKGKSKLTTHYSVMGHKLVLISRTDYKGIDVMGKVIVE